MTFDFFNASNLAFGAKLTTAFTQLENLANAAESNLERVKYNASVLEDYNHKNYLVPRPSSGDRPCRTNDLFDLVDDVQNRIDYLYYEGGKLHVKMHIFKKSNSRMTVATGETTLKEGYAFCKLASSNSKYEVPITFSEEANSNKGEILFQYRIDEKGIININGLDVANLGLVPCDCTQYKSLSLGTEVSNGGDYTAENYECLCVVGRTNNISVNLNGITILKGQGDRCVRHTIIYVKPKDTISGTFSKIFRIDYNQ